MEKDYVFQFVNQVLMEIKTQLTIVIVLLLALQDGLLKMMTPDFVFEFAIAVLLGDQTSCV